MNCFKESTAATMSNLLLKTILLLICLDEVYGDATIILKRVGYTVNGKDWINKPCDFLLTPKCDPMFTFCLDRADGGDTDYDVCSIRHYAQTERYKDKNHISFIPNTHLPGNTVYNPLTVTVNSYQGFKLKVLVMDNDQSHSDHDLIDRFSYVNSTRPGLNKAQSSWWSVTLSGKRSINPSQLAIELLVYCNDNYYGAACDKWCEAADSDIDGHYTCDPLTGDIVCRPLWENTSEKCTVWKDDCFSNPCQNGATCVDQYRAYTCTCNDGFTGTNCEIISQGCLSNPCQNGGICTDGINGFTCSCPPNYSGKLCEHHNCGTQMTCQNGGACIQNTAGQPMCYCPARYTGSHCEVDKCQLLQCANGGVCVDGVCRCPQGYTGALCDISQCSLIDCENDGTCALGVCKCAQGFTGKYCHIKDTYCLNNPCEHSGTCYISGNGYKCSCLPDYSGVHCEQKLPEGLKNNKVGNTANTVQKIAEDQPIWMIVVIAAIVLAVVVIVLVAAICIRQKRRKESESANQTNLNTADTGNNFNNPVFATTPNMATGVLSSPSVAHKVKIYDNMGPGAVGGYDNNTVHYDNPRNLQNNTTAASMYPPLKPEDWTPIKTPRQSNMYTTVGDMDGSTHNNDTNHRLEKES